MSRPNQELLSGIAFAVFRANGQLLEVADELARPAGLTAAWWQVLGAVVHEPLPVAGIARAMRITRQSVQRIADLLVERSLAEYIDNPAHRRAKLVQPTAAGYAAVRRISPQHARFADRLERTVGADALGELLADLRHLSAALDSLEAADRPAAVSPSRSAQPRASRTRRQDRPTMRAPGIT